jgi:hypothetical protein
MNVPAAKTVLLDDPVRDTSAGNSSNKTEKPGVMYTKSLTEMFNELKSEGAIVQTAVGPHGSFRVSSCKDKAQEEPELMMEIQQIVSEEEGAAQGESSSEYLGLRGEHTLEQQVVSEEEGAGLLARALACATHLPAQEEEAAATTRADDAAVAKKREEETVAKREDEAAAKKREDQEGMKKKRGTGGEKDAVAKKKAEEDKAAEKTAAEKSATEAKVVILAMSKAMWSLMSKDQKAQYNLRFRTETGKFNSSQLTEENSWGLSSLLTMAKQR